MTKTQNIRKNNLLKTNIFFLNDYLTFFYEQKLEKQIKKIIFY